MTTTTQAPELSVDQALELARDLLRQLAQNVGDVNALNATFLHWCDVLEPSNFTRVCMAALQTTFTECLTMTPIDDLPPGAHVYVTPAPEELA